MRRYSPLLSLLLAGCLHSPYATPPVPTPAGFAHAGDAATDAPMGDSYWLAFGDPQLNLLVERALVGNDDLAAAALRVKAARDQAGLSRLDQFPSASAGIDATSGSGAGTYRASVSVSYEADLWGRLANATRAAAFEAEATEEDRQAVRLTLVGTVCQLYWDIAFTHQQITAGEASLAYDRKVLDLVNVQHEAGSVSGVEVAEAQQTVNGQVADLAGLQQQLVEYRSALTVVLGGVPLDEAAEPQALPQMALPDVRAGLPAELLARRPDLRAAEARLRETLAGVDIARAQLYPTLSLTASGGGASSDLGSVLSNTSGSVGAGLSLPFLDYPRRLLNVRVSKDQYEVAVANFRKILVQAMADTDTALSARTQLGVQGDSLVATLADAERAESLYAIRYHAGAVPLRTWLDAQESLRRARLNLDSNRLEQLVNQSTLYQALGGGL